MTTEKSCGWTQRVALAIQLAAVSVAGVLLFAYGAAASDEQALSSSYEAAPESTSAPPSKRLLVGTWREVREGVLVRFQRDDTFKIGNQLTAPFAIGTYTVSGSVVRFKPVGPWCLEPWVWRASVRGAALDVFFVTRACTEAKGTKWRFARIS